MTFENVMIKKKCRHQNRYAQYYTMIYNFTIKCCKLTNPIIENVFLSSLLSLRNSFVLGTNI